MNITTATAIQLLVVYGTVPSFMCCYALHEHLKQKKQARQNQERQGRNDPDPIPANAPPLPKPKGCTDQQYTDSEKELERFMDRIARGLDPDKPFLGIDRVATQQYLRDKNN